VVEYERGEGGRGTKRNRGNRIFSKNSTEHIRVEQCLIFVSVRYKVYSGEDISNTFPSFLRGISRTVSFFVSDGLQQQIRGTRAVNERTLKNIVFFFF